MADDAPRFYWLKQTPLAPRVGDVSDEQINEMMGTIIDELIHLRKENAALHTQLRDSEDVCSAREIRIQELEESGRRWIVECSTCLENLSAVVETLKPRILPCGHSVCTGCTGRLLATLPAGDDRHRAVNCPICCAEFVIDLDLGVHNFPINFLFTKFEKLAEMEHFKKAKCLVFGVSTTTPIDIRKFFNANDFSIDVSSISMESVCQLRDNCKRLASFEEARIHLPKVELEEMALALGLAIHEDRKVYDPIDGTDQQLIFSSEEFHLNYMTIHPLYLFVRRVKNAKGL